MSPRKSLLALSIALALSLQTAQAIPRQTVISRARAFATHPWRCTSANLTASCVPAGYQSDFIVGDHAGLPYDWGGFMTLHEFDTQIAEGYAAGSHSDDGVLSCTSGLDCSGYVSQCWRAGHNSTRTIPNISTEIAREDMVRGDAFNKAGSHVILFSHLKADGTPYMYESSGYHVHPTFTKGWSYVNGYIPRRYNHIEDAPRGEPLGSIDRPIDITNFPYSVRNRTTDAPSDHFDYCAAAPTVDETGPEQVYRVNLTSPGILTASVACDPNVDIDVHFYSSLSESSCFARHDTSITHAVDCGEYFIVADTYVSNGTELAGAYTLTVDFTPTGASCNRRQDFDLAGDLGAPCGAGYMDCNWSLEATDCISNNGTRYCSRACSSDDDCRRMTGGCCRQVSSGANMCIYASDCPVFDPDASVPDATVVDAAVEDAGGSGGEPDSSIPAGSGGSSEAPDSGSTGGMGGGEAGGAGGGSGSSGSSGTGGASADAAVGGGSGSSGGHGDPSPRVDAGSAGSDSHPIDVQAPDSGTGMASSARSNEPRIVEASSCTALPGASHSSAAALLLALTLCAPLRPRRRRP